MEKQLTLNESVREAIALALIRLMQKKPLAAISVSEIVRVAGVGRSSFYRNFKSKEDVLADHLHRLYAQSFAAGELPPRSHDRGESARFLLPRFRFIKEHRAFFTVLRDNNLLFLMFDRLESEVVQRLTGFATQVPAYYAAAFSGACAGIVRLWIDSDFAETEEELVTLFANRLL